MLKITLFMSTNDDWAVSVMKNIIRHRSKDCSSDGSQSSSSHHYHVHSFILSNVTQSVSCISFFSNMFMPHATSLHIVKSYQLIFTARHPKDDGRLYFQSVHISGGGSQVPVSDPGGYPI